MTICIFEIRGLFKKQTYNYRVPKEIRKSELRVEMTPYGGEDFIADGHRLIP
jgi:hypothetical protein